MRIVSWNVNGFRAREKAGAVKALKALEPDIVCLQEVRAKFDQLTADTREYLNSFSRWIISNHEKAGYAGALCASRINPVDGLWSFKPEAELGREAILEFSNFIAMSIYSPNSGRSLEKLDHRLEWETQLRDYILNQPTKKPFILCGDMNVAPEKIDCNVFSKAGISKEERQAFTDLLSLDLVDVYRWKHPFDQKFTWFSNQYDSRAVNKGMRIDHFLVSKSLLPQVKDCFIVTDPEIICGSDHNPIVLDIDM